MKKRLLLIIITSLFLLLHNQVFTQENAEINTTKITNNLYKIYIDGVHVMAYITQDGVLLSDAGRKGLCEELRAELKKLGNDHVKFIIDTHWHHDHIGCNGAFEDAVIIAHPLVYQFISEDQQVMDSHYEAFPENAWPDLLFDDTLRIHLDNELIEVIHLLPGHTGCNSVTYFKKSNVLHLNDNIFIGYYPPIDEGHGGEASGYYKNLLLLADYLPDDTKVITGHFDDITVDEMRAHALEIKVMFKTVQQAMQKGKTLEQMKEEDVLSDWQWKDGAWPKDAWIENIYNSLSGK